jgi:hypothetical protein
MLLASALIPSQPAAAAVSQRSAYHCATPTYSFYPGTLGTRIRYGRVTVQLEACTTQLAHQYKATVLYNEENGTGKLIWVDFRPAYFVVTATGRTSRTWDLHFGFNFDYPGAGAFWEAGWVAKCSMVRHEGRMYPRLREIRQVHGGLYAVYRTP